MFVAHFLCIGYQTGTLDCQNKGTYLEDACCSYSGYCDFYDSLEHELLYHTALQYLEFEQEQLQITEKNSNMIILQSVFFKKVELSDLSHIL